VKRGREPWEPGKDLSNITTRQIAQNNGLGRGTADTVKGKEERDVEEVVAGREVVGGKALNQKLWRVFSLSGKKLPYHGYIQLLQRKGAALQTKTKKAD